MCQVKRVNNRIIRQIIPILKDKLKILYAVNMQTNGTKGRIYLGDAPDEETR
jgi:hypothetical protein